MNVSKSDFLNGMPKVELHAHLNGSLCTNSVLELAKAVHGSYTLEFAALCEKFTSFENIGEATLTQCFEKFKFIHSLTASPDGLKLATELVIRDFAKDNVIYLELRTTPKTNDNMTKREYLECVLSAIKAAKEKYPSILVKLLPSIDRSLPPSEAKENVQLALEFHKIEPDLIAGLDLSGNPACGVFADFVPYLREARQNDLKLTLHCAEIDSKLEIEQMIEFGMDRCGHGTFLSEAQIDLLKQRQVPIECCLTSNVKCGTVQNYFDHHMKHIMEAKCPIALCTDDSGVFDTTLTQEFMIAANVFNLSEAQCLELTLSAVNYAFASEKEKDSMVQKINEYRAQTVKF